MDLAARVKDIINLSEFDQRPRYLELRDALRTLDDAPVRALLAEGLAVHDRAVQQAGPPTPWLKGPDDRGLDLVLWIAQVRPDVCEGLPAELWQRHVFGHGVLYRGADAATRDALLAECDAALTFLMRTFADLIERRARWGEPAFRDRISTMSHTREWKLLNIWLRMAAWIGDGAVQHWFASWRTVLPGWDSLFYLPLEAYVSEGGWEMLPGGGRRELTFPVAYQMVVAAVAHAESAHGADLISGGTEPLAVMVPHDEQCHWCGRRMTALLDLDLRHETLAFLRLKGSRLRLVMCEECSLWNQLFMDVDLEGNARWCVHNPPDADIPSNDGEMFFTPPTHRLVLDAPCTSLVEVAARGDGPDVSQLGGFPAWVQDAEYRQCPSCYQRMMFVGQVMPDMITDRAIDGLLYGLLCPACLCSTVVYQCT